MKLWNYTKLNGTVLCAGKMCSVVVLKKGPVVEAEKSIASQLRQVRLILNRNNFLPNYA
jgi:hypothetical protein